MNNPELVVLAAGMGSRYGGLKQIDPVDNNGHIIIDFSIYDAIKAGFKTINFIIKKEIEKEFREVMDTHLEGKGVTVRYIFQELDKLPRGFTVPEGRRKPWGTAHAIACCHGAVNAPFAVINADDYYGANAFAELYNFLAELREDTDVASYAMVGYKVKNTVTEQGTVSRGVCDIEDGRLVGINERTKIGTGEDGIYYEEDGVRYPLDPDTVVSMNLWGFPKSYIDECHKRFASFLSENLAKNPEKCEFFMPLVISEMVKEGKAEVTVLENRDKWYGVTYKEDKPEVVEAFARLIGEGVYPEKF